MIKKSLLFIESPLQMLNAYEAVNYFQFEKYFYIVRLSDFEINDAQIVNLIKLLKINKSRIKYLHISAKNKTPLDYIKLFIFRYRYVLSQNIDKVCIGNYESSFFKLIKKQFKKNKVILLDDGAKSISIQNEFSVDNYYDLFTMYDVKPLAQQAIYKNEYKSLLSKIDRKSRINDEVLFLGMKLSEVGIINETCYIELLQSICSYYANKQIIYIMHRGESKEKLDTIAKNSNITIKQLDYPVELYGLYENQLPYKISSFYSTALLTMQNIYQVEAECFMFNYANSIYKNSIDDVYQYYRKHINVKELS